ncbi:MAG: PaaI family thioesterase [Burkholderia sp.]|nr:PaaI family thioesterase [Burkholderia sp.]
MITNLDYLLVESPFSELIGTRLIHAHEGESEVALSLSKKHMNGWHIAHGGVIMTLSDVTLAIAACSLLKDRSIGVVTIEMKVSFMQQGNSELRSVGRVLHRSTKIAYCEGEIYDASERFIAKSLGTFRYIKR